MLMLLENNPYPQDVRVRQEANTLAAAGYRVAVIGPGRRGQAWRETIGAVHVYRFPEPPEASGFLGYLWEYGYATTAMLLLSLYVFFERGFDIVHAHNPPDTLVFVAALYKLAGRRFVYDHHDLAPEMYQALFAARANAMVHRLLIRLERFSCRLADRVIVTNRSYRDVALERAGVPASKITVVRNGPDLTLWREPSRAAPQPEETTICYVGTMGRHDGVDHLLQALHHLAHTLDRSDFRCVLVGDGEARPHLAALSERLRLGERVHFAGRVAHDEVPGFLEAADLCVAPEPSNPYNDRSTMIKIMEYMAAGRPIVAFDLPEHRFSAREAALYARPNDELDFARRLALLMDDPERRHALGRTGRQRIEAELAWSHQQESLLAAYRAL